MTQTKRLLVLTRDRANSSFRERIAAYLPALAACGVACEVVELADSPVARLRQWRQARQFDGVLLHRKTLTAWDALALGAARELIYDFDDAIIYKDSDPQPTPDRARLRRFRRTVTRASLVIAGNPVLAGHVADCGAAAHVIPTGLDLKSYAAKQDYVQRGPLRLVWIGSRSTLRQLEPFREMFQTLGSSQPDLVLRIIADGQLHAPGLNVENVPWSLETQARLLAEADIGIAPLPDTPFARGKCGFKVLQYMAAGLPVVTSPVGVNGQYVSNGENGLWASTAEEWLAAIRRLAADAALRETMGRAGRARAAGEFDRAVLAPQFCSLIQTTL